MNALWSAVHKEDLEICKRLQLGRASPVEEDGGALSPHKEESVQVFRELVVKTVMGSRNTTKG